MADFDRFINPYTLIFIDSSLEQKYRKKNISAFPPIKSLKIGFIILMILILLRQSELLLLAVAKYNPFSDSNYVFQGFDNHIIVTLYIFLSGFILELTIWYYKKLKPMKGIPLMISILFILNYLSEKLPSKVMAVIPMYYIFTY